MGALPPLETPTRKGGTLPLHGAHTAFSCYPALRLYRLSKSQRGIDVVSLTLGNSGFPAGDCPAGNRQLFGQLLLRQSLFLTERFEKRSDPDLIHIGASFRPQYSAGWVRLTRRKARNAVFFRIGQSCPV